MSQTNIQTGELEQNSLPPSILLNKIQKYNLTLVLVSACAVYNKNILSHFLSHTKNIRIVTSLFTFSNSFFDSIFIFWDFGEIFGFLEKKFLLLLLKWKI